MERFQQVILELRRRRVFRALVVWGVVAFAVLQVYEPVMHGLHLPEWTLSFVVVVLGLGFPVTAALAWVFDLKASGIERTPPSGEEDGRDRGRGCDVPVSRSSSSGSAPWRPRPASSTSSSGQVRGVAPGRLRAIQPRRACLPSRCCRSST